VRDVTGGRQVRCHGGGSSEMGQKDGQIVTGRLAHLLDGGATARYASSYLTISSKPEFGIATTLWAGRSGDRFPATVTSFALLRNVQTGSGAHPSKVSEVLSLGLKRLGA
jgi:hypothetical protein